MATCFASKEREIPEMGSKLYNFLNKDTTFISHQAHLYRSLYLPLCSITSDKIKSSITPFLSGDIKIDKNRYITKPVSIEDLRNPTRNFFLYVKDKGIFTFDHFNEDDEVTLTVGQLWQRLFVKNAGLGLSVEALSFVPVSGEDVELLKVTVENSGKTSLTVTPTAAIPLFARALANKHDHEHVTSLLNRLTQSEYGVFVEPTMLFNEEGHKEANEVYFCLGITEDKEKPCGSFPTMMSFCGEGGSLSQPEAVIKNLQPAVLSEEQLQGKEAIGALRFKPFEMKPKEKKVFYIAVGTAADQKSAIDIFNRFNTQKQLEKALTENEAFWKSKAHSIRFETGNSDYNSWLHWVELQPLLRRIYGCSFLPDHDYGKGGKGWRDIWQDLLSLILIEPQEVRETLINNFAGVRIDGSNATIIGSKPGEFIADRNAITRVWMDHGVWPLATLLLYINQTGDYDILLEENTYFRDPQLSRTYKKDTLWNSSYGNQLKNEKGRIVRGSIIEHLLIEHLVPFFNVGSHNIIRLENADWNDGLDMAVENGESVTFMSFYGSNLQELATLLEDLSVRKRINGISLAREVFILLDTINGKPIDYDNVTQKKSLLLDSYFNPVEPDISGEKEDVSIKNLVRDLRRKARWIFAHINKQEKVKVEKDGEEYIWFNGYYDNQKEKVEGLKENRVRMTLTGQVFPIMSGLAIDEDVAQVVKSVRKFLKDPHLGGFRLNSDFGVKHYLALGRAFGFAFGTKENGAFFSHMTVMYAFALYKRGFVKEGFEVLNSIYAMSIDSEKSKIFPGIPEYFDSEGRGKYHYLTGSASWYIYTVLTQVFGVSGKQGDLVIAPQLVKEQFDSNKEAKVSCKFAGRDVTVCYVNRTELDYGEYEVGEVTLNGKVFDCKRIGPNQIRIDRNWVEKTEADVKIGVTLVRAGG